MRKTASCIAAGVLAIGIVTAMRLASMGGQTRRRNEVCHSARSLPSQAASRGGLVIEPQDAYQSVYEEISSLTFTFNIINTSAHTVTIQRIMPDCGCTSVEIEARELWPQQKTALRVVYDAQGLFGELPRRKIKVLSDDTANPVIECSVSGYRQQRFIITPPTADLGVVLVGERHSTTVTVKTSGLDMELVPEKIMVDSPWLTVDVLDYSTSPDGGGTLVLDIGVKKETPQGSIQGRAFVPRIQDDGIGPIIPVRARISGPVRLMPPKVFVGILPRDGTVTRTVEVKAAILPSSQKGPGSLYITGFKTVAPSLRLSRAEHNPGVVCITVAASEIEPGQFEEHAIITCTIDGEPCEALLSVCGMVAE